MLNTRQQEYMRKIHEVGMLMVKWITALTQISEDRALYR